MDSEDSPLLKAVQLYLTGVRTEEAGTSATRVVACLEDGDWEMALLLLEDLGDVDPQPPEFWSRLAAAARLMWLKNDADWYEWRRGEARSGAFRAELCLDRTEDGGRALPISPGDALRPMWDIGRRTPEGGPLWSIALLWVEGRGSLKPGGCGLVRLLPLTPGHWWHLEPGDLITMHERRRPSGTARIIEVMPPVMTAPQLQF
ncbi:hypothetical protein [Nonomuraea sp. NPDC003709]|uniref:hypothetical protein n=1 Tax=Nonomuraea sp. NPDC003709 TaxID=3154450 RepID=UPI0033AC114A